MEQNKLLYHFNKESDFLANQINLPNTGIAFVKDSQTIYTHEKEYNMVSWGELKIENGVYVYTNKGELIKPEEWDTGRNEEAVGVAVITDNTRMCITKGEKPLRAWSVQLYGTDIPEIINSSDLGTDDYNGQSNTTAIIAAATSENESINAAYYCYSQTISINGNMIHGYLPASGELKDAYNNKSNINNAMNKIGGNTILDEWHWSSSEYGRVDPANNAWGLYWYNGLTGTRSKNYNIYTIPCFPID